MAKRISLSDVLELSVAERIELAEDIWDSVACIPDGVTLSQRQKEELDRRLAAYRDNPESGSPWEEVKARIGRSA